MYSATHTVDCALCSSTCNILKSPGDLCESCNLWEMAQEVDVTSKSFYFRKLTSLCRGWPCTGHSQEQWITACQYQSWCCGLWSNWEVISFTTFMFIGYRWMFKLILILYVYSSLLISFLKWIQYFCSCCSWFLL